MRKYLLRYIYTALLFEIIIVTPVLSQGQRTTSVPPFTAQYNQHYNVKVGDEVTYKYQTLYAKNGYFPGGVILENLSFVPFNLTQGMDFTILINSTTNDSVEAQYIYNLPKLGKLISTSFLLDAPYLIGAFNNVSMAEQWVNDQSTSNPEFQYSISGNYITIVSGNSQSKETIVTNWKTGWLESDNSIEDFSNGTIMQRIQIVRINSVFGINLNLILNLVTYSIIPIFFAIGAFLAIKLRRQKGNSNK